MKINVPEKYADLYTKALSERKQQLEKKIEDFRKEILEIDNHISNLTSMSIFNDQQAGNKLPNLIAYSPSWPWTKKIAHYQEVIPKLMTSNDAVEFILSNEPDLDKAKVRSSVSAALSNGLKSRKYTKFIDPSGVSSFYGPSDWFNSEGQPQLEYVPDDLKNRIFKNQ
jgi:hypothetical protein